MISCHYGIVITYSRNTNQITTTGSHMYSYIHVYMYMCTCINGTPTCINSTSVVQIRF